MKALRRRVLRLQQDIAPRFNLAATVEAVRKRARQDPEGLARDLETRRAAIVAQAERDIAAGRRLSPITEKLLGVYRRGGKAAPATTVIEGGEARP
jgi:hypothetical protein